eukprot:924421_1
MSHLMWFNWLFVIIQFDGSTSNNCTVTNPVICITGQTSYNDWFYVEYDYDGCYGDNPYYYNATNNQYIYWNYQLSRWHSYTIVGSNGNMAYAYPTTEDSLFSTNGKWSVNSPDIGTNTDPCLEVHSSSCSTSTALDCNVCNNAVTSICIAGTTSYNDWFYTQYDYGGCYGDKPYYYNAANNQYIYWNYQLSRWHSYTTVGSNGNTAYAYPSTGESLFSTDGRWSVNSPIIGTNTDPNLIVQDCSGSLVTSNPSSSPTTIPTGTPTSNPSKNPIPSASNNPTISPSENPPTESPTLNPTKRVTVNPSNNPTLSPLLTANPTMYPTKSPQTTDPSSSPTTVPSLIPTVSPTMNPTASPILTFNPSTFPSYIPTSSPTTNPSLNPTINPTLSPSQVPSVFPTKYPSSSPTSSPTSLSPTESPTLNPTKRVTVNPSNNPTLSPLLTANPTMYPTKSPQTTDPSSSPTTVPSLIPTVSPTMNPT